MNDYVTRYDWFTRIIEGPDGKKGMEDPAGKVLIPAVFDEVAYTYDTNFIQPSAVPCVKSGKCALVKTDGTGENITPLLGSLYEVRMQGISSLPSRVMMPKDLLPFFVYK